MNPRPILADLAACYPAGYCPHRPSEETATTPPPRPWYARPPFRWIPGLRWFYHYLNRDFSQLFPAPPQAGAQALEIGAGRGDFLDKLTPLGWQVTAIEPVAQAAAQIQSKGYTVHSTLLEDAPLETATFDAVFAWMVLEHVVSPRDALQRISHWLKPNGQFFFSVPNFGSLEHHLFGRYWIAWEAPRHLHQFTPAVLRRILREAGFEHVQIIHQRNIRDYYGSLGAWLLHRNPTSRLGRRLMHWFTDAPPLGIHLLLAPLAILLSWMRQGGRITVIARK